MNRLAPTGRDACPPGMVVNLRPHCATVDSLRLNAMALPSVRIGFVVEDGELGDGRALALDVDHLLTPVYAFAEPAQRPTYDEEWEVSTRIEGS